MKTNHRPKERQTTPPFPFVAGVESSRYVGVKGSRSFASEQHASTGARRKSPRLQQIRQSFVKPQKHDFVQQWMTEGFRCALAECIPYIVGLIWRDEEVDLRRIARIPILALAESSESGSHLDKQSVWYRFFDYVRPKPQLFNTAALILALPFTLRLKKLYTRRHYEKDAPFLSHAAASSVGSAQHEFTIYFMCVLLAMKYTEDKPLENESWSRIIGLPLAQVNQMEIEGLRLMNHGLFVGPEEFDSWLSCLESVMRTATPPLGGCRLGTETEGSIQGGPQTHESRRLSR